MGHNMVFIFVLTTLKILSCQRVARLGMRLAKVVAGSEWWRYLTSQFEQADTENKKIIVLGDANLSTITMQQFINSCMFKMITFPKYYSLIIVFTLKSPQ